MANLSKRLEAHFVACAAAAACVGAVSTANAAITYSGPVNIVIPDNIDGIYMNVVTAATGTSGGGVSGWDINPYTASAGWFNLWGPTTTTWANVADNYNLPFGTPINAGSSYNRPGGAANTGLQFNLNSTNNYVGFQFANEANGGATHYGWAQLSFGATYGERSIIGYAYEGTAGTGVGAGVVPAPASMALLALGGLAGARRRR